MSAEEELDALIGRRGANSIRVRLVKVIHRPKVQLFFIFLLILDVVVLFVELFIDAEYPRCSIVIRDATSCCPGAYASGSVSSSASVSGSASGSGSGGYHALCGAYDIGVDADCDSHQHALVHKLHDALFGTSVVILSAFAAELTLLLLALDCQFFHHLLYVIDAVVVFSSLTLEIVLYTTAAGNLAGALILARLWRFVRVSHGLVVSSHEAAEISHERQEAIKEHLAEIERAHHELVRQSHTHAAHQGQIGS